MNFLLSILQRSTRVYTYTHTHSTHTKTGKHITIPLSALTRQEIKLHRIGLYSGNMTDGSSNGNNCPWPFVAFFLKRGTSKYSLSISCVRCLPVGEDVNGCVCCVLVRLGQTEGSACWLVSARNAQYTTHKPHPTALHQGHTWLKHACTHTTLISLNGKWPAFIQSALQFASCWPKRWLFTHKWQEAAAQGEGGQTLCSDNHQGVVVFGPGGRNWAPEPGPDLTFFRDIMTEIKTQKRTLTEKAKKRNESDRWSKKDAGDVEL